MNIRAIQIYGYGKWVDVHFDSLEPLQVFQGANEAGKSTLFSFITSMLFGFPTAHKKNQNQYIPRTTQSYGGRLYVTNTRFGELIIERMKDRHKGKAVLIYPDGNEQIVNNLGRYLFGVDKETYQLLYTFSLDSLLQLNSTRPEDLNRYLLGIGTSGSEKLLQLAARYQSQATQLFKPGGSVPPLNQKIKELETVYRRLQQAKQKNTQYETLLLQRANLLEKMEEWETARAACLNENSELEERLRLASEYEEWTELKKQLAVLEAGYIPEDGRYQMDKISEDLFRLMPQEAQLNEQLRQLQKELKEFSFAAFYTEQEQVITRLQQQSTKLLQVPTELHYDRQHADEYRRELQEMTGRYSFDGKTLPDLLDQEDRESAAGMLRTTAELERQYAKNQQELQLLQAQLEQQQKESQLVQQNLMEEGRFRQLQAQVQDRPQQSVPKTVEPGTGKTPWLLFGLALAALVAGMVLNQWRYPILLAAGCLLGLGFWLMKRRNPDIPVSGHTGGMELPAAPMDQYIRQVTLREKQAELLQRKNEIERQIKQRQKEKIALENGLETNQEHQQAFLASRGYSDRLSLEQLLQEEPAVRLERLQQQLEKMETAIQSKETELDSWYQATAFLRKQMQLEDYDAEKMLESFAELVQSLRIEASMAASVQEQIEEKERMLAALKQEIGQKQEQRQLLFEQAQVNSEAAFYQLVQTKEKRNENEKRKAFLDRQLEQAAPVFAKYPDVSKSREILENNRRLLREQEEDYRNWQKQEIELQHQLQMLEKGGTYSSLLQEAAMTETRLRELAAEWGGKIIAGELIEGTLRYGKENRLPNMMTDASEYFSLLTGYSYKEVQFLKSGLKVLRKDGQSFQPHELSKGTVEQLYVAIRLAFIKNTRDIVNMPILMDDSFVNFDPERRQTMYKLMKKVSGQVQILFFTFDDAVEKQFLPQQVFMLK